MCYYNGLSVENTSLLITLSAVRPRPEEPLNSAGLR